MSEIVYCPVSLVVKCFDLGRAVPEPYAPIADTYKGINGVTARQVSVGTSARASDVTGGSDF